MITKEQLQKFLEPYLFEYEIIDKLKFSEQYFLDCSRSINAKTLTILNRDGIINEFEKVFHITTSMLRKINSEKLTDLYTIENGFALRQNMSVVASLTQSGGVSFRSLPVISRWILNLFLFKYEENTRFNRTTLLDIASALQRISQLIGISIFDAKVYSGRDENAVTIDGLFDLNKSDKGRILVYLDNALEVINSLHSENKQTLEIISETIIELKQETVKEKPKWSIILSKLAQLLIITAALTSGIADAKNAHENLRKAWNTIVENSTSNFDTNNQINYDLYPKGLIDEPKF
ncbi:hypothetical protein LFX25_19685 [Leptospira sp. FAT2]|uniref:hypothetical protein n=1 Tax=Leptospira sanjuanensis TaxID=2879643 RepID=UPI001EE939E5|nr:hypothetical protein [Leptospira sanjuanensis]MCG6170128.1 hypothetical protein [Leptospira sanjuanensis]MCG6170163.1 hypothetical protein [Leptospira sanjuanensis]MCG6195467.1 hypothetical protein [Leptospira sanjuanensis]